MSLWLPLPHKNSFLFLKQFKKFSFFDTRLMTYRIVWDLQLFFYVKSLLFIFASAVICAISDFSTPVDSFNSSLIYYNIAYGMRAASHRLWHNQQIPQCNVVTLQLISLKKKFIEITNYFDCSSNLNYGFYHLIIIMISLFTKSIV